MSYTDVDLVKSEFRSLEVTANSAVSESDVETFIAQSENYINAKIGHRYQLPITKVSNPVGHSILSLIATYMVVCRIKRVLEVKNVVREADQIVKNVDYCKEAKDMLDEVVNGKLTLPDSPVAADSTGGVDSFNVQNDTPYDFKTSGKQW